MVIETSQIEWFNFERSHLYGRSAFYTLLWIPPASWRIRNRETIMGDVERGIIVVATSDAVQRWLRISICCDDLLSNIFYKNAFIQFLSYFIILKNVLRCQTSAHQIWPMQKLLTTSTTLLALWLLNVNQYVNI